jgi:hypothetical protein
MIGVRSWLIVRLAEYRRLWSSTAARRAGSRVPHHLLAAGVSDRLAVPADAVEILNAVLRLGQAQILGELVRRIGRA